MDAEDDDFYSPNGASEDLKHVDMDLGDDSKDEDRDEELEEGEEEDSSDADSVKIIVDDNVLGPSAPRFTPSVKPESQQPPPTSQQATQEQQETPKKERATTPSKATSTGPLSLKNGADYPEVHTSSVDVNADPIYQPVGKPISQVDIDADLAEHAKPWRLPGADQSDYFNYGFDEFTWASYVLRQQNMAAALRDQKEQTAQFQSMFGAIPGMPGMPGSQPSNNVPTGPAATQQPNPAAAMGAGMGMGSPEDMMSAMYQFMAAQGISDPNQVDFNQFMQQMGGQMGMQPVAGAPTGPAAQQGGQGQGAYGGYGNYGGGQGGGGGGGGGGYGGRGGRRGRGW